MNGAAEVASIPSILVSRNFRIDTSYCSYVGFIMLGTLGVSIVSVSCVFVSQLNADGMDGIIGLAIDGVLFASFSAIALQ